MNIDKLLINNTLNSIWRIEEKIRKNNNSNLFNMEYLEDINTIKQFLKYKRDELNK